MKNYLLACVCSAVAGGTLAFWIGGDFSRTVAHAQDATNPPLSPIIQPGTTLIDDTNAATRSRVSPPNGSPLDDEYTPDELVNIKVYDRANRSVVHITTRTTRPGGFFMTEVPAAGEGSGSVFDMQGHILTNYHVIEGAREVRVTLFNGETYEAGLIGKDPPNDIAVLKINAPQKSLYPVQLGDSSRLRVGQKILAIGNPFGLERTLTVGVVSSLNRAIPSKTGRQMKSIIQIDAALNSGNSGGPLLNSRAELVGMNTAIVNPSQSGENTGVGFSIPVNTIRRVVPQLLEHGRVIRPVIGIASVYETDRGLVIVDVAPGGPAARAGLRGFEVVTQKEQRGPFIYERTYVDRERADRIISVDGIAVSTGDEFQDVVESKQPGDRIVVRVIRDNRELDVPVALGASE
ncbi:MAG: trypsin-like peptidase domain-containing protein [Planctomycetaceae bacterium]|nr:trypsin-like peptidase domain-containing protein [Planctomycetales bacterium]MCB9926569.1 trypsin-like peptidase domain-containing protein [Planctomycetaceae bacterium]